MSAAIQRYLPGLEGERRSVDLSQWYTPDDLARRVWTWATKSRENVRRVLEPSAGRGALATHALRDFRTQRVTAIDIDSGNCDALRESPRRGRKLTVVRGDFLSFTPRDRFDIALMNPPYENNLDASFVVHALGFAPVVVGIFRSAFLHGAWRWDNLWSRVELQGLVYLVDRPKFGDGDGARSDFCVAEFVRREGSPRGRGEANGALTVEWW